MFIFEEMMPIVNAPTTRDAKLLYCIIYYKKDYYSQLISTHFDNLIATRTAIYEKVTLSIKNMKKCAIINRIIIKLKQNCQKPITLKSW